jgi:hypothetical protein
MIIDELLYVTVDPFFLPSMAFTTMMGIFIGAVIYDGKYQELKKMVISLMCYMILIVTVTLTRVGPQIASGTHGVHPLASIITIFMVSIFYGFGTFLGVRITKHVHCKKLIP